jgi:hypothetical protein
METEQDTAVTMVEETAVDNMSLVTIITNVDIEDTANKNAEDVVPDLLANDNADDDKPYRLGDTKGLFAALVIFLIFLVAAAISSSVTMGVIVASRVDDSGDFRNSTTAAPDGTAEMTSDPLEMVSDDPPEMPAVRKSNVDQVIAYMVNASVSDLTDLLTIGSPQNRAAIWMAEQDAADTAVPTGNTTALEGYNYMVRYVMAVFYYSTGGDNWNDQYFSMTFAPVCDWNNVIDGPNAYRQGIICGEETDLVFGLDFGT